MASPSDQDGSNPFAGMLSRLDRTIERLRGGAEALDELLHSWEDRWQRQHQRILERMQRIDGQLARVRVPTSSGSEASGRPNSAPRFGIVGAPTDASTMRSMVE